jgi:hypothetical protein
MRDKAALSKRSNKLAGTDSTSKQIERLRSTFRRHGLTVASARRRRATLHADYVNRQETALCQRRSKHSPLQWSAPEGSYYSDIGPNFPAAPYGYARPSYRNYRERLRSDFSRRVGYPGGETVVWPQCKGQCYDPQPKLLECLRPTRMTNRSVICFVIVVLNYSSPVAAYASREPDSTSKQFHAN